MPTLEADTLVFRFPDLADTASLAIEFQRTLRIPDTGRTYWLPPGLGRFPLRHAADHASRLPPQTAARGGVILPIWQAEAMWLNFRTSSPFAIKVAAGKINAVSGEPWRPGLHRAPQDYLVTPEQPWLDGFAIEPGIIRQFVAMELGEGYTVESQVSGEEQWGGLQIQVIPLKPAAWEKWHRRGLESTMMFQTASSEMMSVSECSMGLAAGGRMNQVIHPDRFRPDDWDVAAADRVFVSLLHARDWKRITGEDAPELPPTAQDYARAGLPWYEHYGRDQDVLPGSDRLAAVHSLATLFKDKTGATLPHSQDVATPAPIPVGPGAGRRRRRRIDTGTW